MSGADVLVCPNCGRAQLASVHFCPDCGLPLVPAETKAPGPVDERHARARKIKPHLTEGRLVRVAGAHNQAEAELLQSLLLEAGVPSMLRRSAGFDVPDFLAAGPRDVLVPESAAATAREVLLEAELVQEIAPGTVVSPWRLLAGLLVALAVVALIIWGLTALAH
jgi:hypothetical protein